MFRRWNRSMPAVRRASRNLHLTKLEDRTVPANISGTVFDDWNANGSLNTNDPGLSGQVVYIDENTNGAFDTTVQNYSFASSDGPVAIPDYAGGVVGVATSTIAVTGFVGSLSDVNVTINITHTWVEDLSIRLISPDGTAIYLVNRYGADGDNFYGTEFDDGAAVSITTITGPDNPFTGSYQPEEPLSTFNLTDESIVNGAWVLEVTDNAGGDTGSIDSWSMSLTSSERAARTDSSGAYTFTNLNAGSYTIRSLVAGGQTATGPASYAVALGGTDVTGRDFGRLEQNAIYGTAFNDADNSGTLNGSETLLPGVTTFLDLDSDGNLDTGTATAASVDPPVAIPDYVDPTPGLALMPLTVSGTTLPIESVRVTVNITHTYAGDLILTLIAPGGQRVVLANQRGGDSDNYTGTVFDDAATDPIGIDPVPPGFPGSFRPDEPLSALAGLSGSDVNGIWNLEVTDNAGLDTGTIDSFAIDLNLSEVNTVTDALGNYHFSNMAAGTHSVRAVSPAGLSQTAPAGGTGYTVTLAAGDTANNKDFGFGTGGGGTPPAVTGTSVNGNATQRSRVTTLDVTFSAQVSFAGAVASAFTLTRTGGGAVSFTATANVVGGVTVVTLNNFTGAEAEFGSLRDGRYTLTALANQISAGGTSMTSNYTYGDAQGLFRFYGDMNADRRVDISDFGFFSLAYLTPGNYNSALDFNQDTRVDIADFGQFSVRYFTTLP